MDVDSPQKRIFSVLEEEHGFDDKLLNMALLGKPDDMVEAARYYEFKPGHQDKAVMLYHKAGYFSKALELAFSSKEYSALQMVSESLDESTDPNLLQRCADFFIDNSQFDRAVDLLAAAKRYWDALKICMEQDVPMTEELVEKLTPSKEMEERDVDERNKILKGIGEVCMAQRQYHLGTKKFTQAGNRVTLSEFKASIGNERYLMVKGYKDQLLVHIREYDERYYPTKMGVAFSKTAWARFLSHLDEIGKAVDLLKANQPVDFYQHIGGRYYVSISKNFPCINIRRYFLPPNTVKERPTRSGIGVRLGEWPILLQKISMLHAQFPELKDVKPCNMDQDHANQLGYLSCTICNPFGL